MISQQLNPISIAVLNEIIVPQKMQKQGMINKSGILPEFTGEGIFVGYWRLQIETTKLTICYRMRRILSIPRSGENSIMAVLRLMSTNQRRELINEIKYCQEIGTNFEKDIKVVTAQGKTKWIKVAGTLYHRRWGKAEQIIGTIEDITQKVTENAIALAIVNHELRGPLTIIKLNVQMLRNMMAGGLNQYPVKLLSKVDLHIDTMTRVMEEYLSTPCNENRERELNYTVFDINDLVDTIVGEMKTMHQSYRFNKVPGATILVRADKYQIIQVLINYISNAINFSPPCSHIKIEIVNFDGLVEIGIHDPGIGIAVGQEKHLFQRFYSLESKAVRMKNSKGLGLYVVKQIINQHKGSVRAERGKEGGSAFYFTLPVYQEDVADNAVDMSAVGDN
jgi:two-component system sensor histidine kinase VicK